MRSWTQMNSDYQRWTDTSTANVTAGGISLNDSIRTVCNLRGGKLRFLESTTDMVTVASQESYQIPNKYRKLIDLYIFDGSTGNPTDTLYAPRLIYDPKIWKRVLQSKLGTQQVPYFVYVEGTTFKIQPIPDTSGNKITVRGRLNTRDLSIDDYTTGTIVSIANGDTTVTGSGTTWTADMVGRYIKITETTAAGGGDGFWYEIGSYTSATEIDLVKPYTGTTIAAGSATYTIGQMSVIPEAYDIAPVYRATALYWQDKGDSAKAERYWRLYDGGNEAGLIKTYGGVIGQMLENEGETEEGAYIPPIDQGAGINTDYWYPWQNASGF